MKCAKNKIGTDEKKPKNWGALPYKNFSRKWKRTEWIGLPKNMVYPDVQFIAEQNWQKKQKNCFVTSDKNKYGTME